MRPCAFPLVCLPLAGCFWHPVGGDARPRMGLEAVERSPAAGAPGQRDRPMVEPGARGWFFSDSLIAIRTQANLASIRLRLWNRGTEPVRIVWSQAAPVGEGGDCPEAAGEWELRGSGAPGDADVLDPGQSRERRVTPAARVRTARGESWEPVRLLCMVYDPAQPRAALRLGVETPGVRFVYTFWYRLMEPPREDPADPPAASALP